MKPLVSIVTPSYNQVQYLEETIQSVLDQDYPNIEYILVDGSSQDGSLEIIHNYMHRLDWWISEKDKGHADALNKGFRHAHGEIMAWINSDDTYLPGAISAVVDFFETHPEARFIYGDANLIDEHSQILGPFPARQTDYRRLLQGFVHIPQQSTFWKAEVWKEVGELDLAYFFAFDYDFSAFHFWCQNFDYLQRRAKFFF